MSNDHIDEANRKRTDAYFGTGGLSRWLFARTKHPVLRFACILLPWYVAAYLVCLHEKALVIDPDITAQDFKDISSLVLNLQSPTNDIHKYVRSRLAEKTRVAIAQVSTNSVMVPADLASQLAADLNGIIRGGRLWEEARFATVDLSRRTKTLAEKSLDGKQLACNNRSLLSESFPKAIEPKPVGLLEDVFMLALFPVLLLGLVMTRRLLAKVEELLEQFPEMVRPGQLPSDWDKQKSVIRNKISRQTVKAKRYYLGFISLCLIFLIFFQVAMPLSGKLPPAWAQAPHRYPISFVFVIAWGAFWFVCIAGNLLWYALATGFSVFPMVRKFADASLLWIVPNAPDGKGGLEPIGQVAFGIMATFGVGMIMVAAWIIAWGFDTGAIIAGGTYTIVVCIAFFLPLQSAHGAMYRAKIEALRKVARLFRDEYEKLPEPKSRALRPPQISTAPYTGDSPILARFDRPDGVELEKQLEVMAKLDALHQTVGKMPVWPFDISTFKKFLLVALTPAISGLIHQIWPTLALELPEAIKEVLPKL